MKDNLVIIVSMICIVAMMLGLTICETIRETKTEHTKQLEQSLAEQIQEKQVYINILERSSNGD